MYYYCVTAEEQCGMVQNNLDFVIPAQILGKILTLNHLLNSDKLNTIYFEPSKVWFIVQLTQNIWF